MFNTSKKSNKAKNKKREFKVSPLIAVVAIIEVIVLVVISTYAWFILTTSKVIGSGTISVDADSGLDIDFQYSNVDDYINIWNYVDPKFKFEPATSLDGRNIYFPTSGTFNKTDTEDIVFRDGTVNDINSKYLSIDFELTNTSGSDQYVYLNNNSYFKVKDGSDRYQESRALRLAFYQNDGNSGNVGSSLLNSSNGSSDGGSGSSSSPVSTDAYTVYFDNTSTSWKNVYVYFWDADDGAPIELNAWPGTQMSRVSGKTYSITIDNPKTANGLKYENVIFHNGSGTQYGSFDLKPVDTSIATETSSKWKNWHKFNKNGNQGIYSENTVYFLKPGTWTYDGNDDDTLADVYCHVFNNTNNTYYTSWPGDRMTYVGSGIYAYSYDSDSFNSSNSTQFLFDNNGYNASQTANIDVTAQTNGSLYYCDGTFSDSKLSAQRYTDSSYAEMGYSTIYFFNTYGWSKPYAKVYRGTDSSYAATEVALTSLSGNVFYCTVPNVFSNVYFHQKDQTSSSKKTQVAAIDDQKVYRPTEASSNDGYELNTFYYSSYIKDTGYPVISPGVSAGFQRPYSPVVTIDAFDGNATEIIPAYSNSIDNYILGSGTPLFVLKSGHMASLSMIMWLEGTDESAVGDLYPGNDIDFKLEFSTLYYTQNEGATEAHIVNPGDSASYTYNFYDKTREIWTSDRQPTESGVTVAPVMQLYDNTIKRGYLMHATAYGSYDGQQKVSCWTVDAPQSIARLGHDIYFRRVNPYDEDEVWNYWHAGPVAGSRTKANGEYTPYNTNQTVYPIAMAGTTDTISFTAFADGSPLSSMPGLSDDDDLEFCVPDDSCGGLWGNHNVRTVTVYDGLPGQPLKDNNGVLTVNYTYSYSDGTNTYPVKIEYKASGPNYNSFYYVIMPNVAYANNLDCSFKRYTGFNSGYAINSADKNPNITFFDYYGKGQKISGDYFELNRKTNNEDLSYWGSDMLYIQTNADTKNYVYTSGSPDDSNAKLFQVFFTANNDFSNRSSSNNWYTYLYYNGNFSPSDNSGGSGFACVVPNKLNYSKFRLENCSYNGSTQYNVTDSITILEGSNVSFSDSYTGRSYNMKVRYLDQNGITCTYIGITLYLQTTHCSTGNDPRCHIYDSSGSSPDTWPGYLMKWESNVNNEESFKKFFVEDGTSSHNKVVLNVSKYNKLKFAYYGGSSESAAYTFDMNTVHNNMIFESYYGNGNVGVVSSHSSSNNNTLRFSNNWTSDEWPHLTFKQTS